MIKSMSKSKIKLAYCRLKTAYLPILLMTIILFLTSTTELHPTIHYVSHTGNSTPPYTSWETAADSIQKAIDICEPGDTVFVANGVYKESLLIVKTIHLIGSSMDSTIIDGSAPTSFWVVRFNYNNSTIENFTIRGPGKDIPGILCFAIWSSCIGSAENGISG